MGVFSIFRSGANPERAAATRLYQGVMAAALDPDLFDRCQIPDTFDARAGLVTAMASLAIVRLNAIEGEASPRARRLIERLNAKVLDGFDAAYREKGVGDHSIARKVRTLAEAHTGLGRALTAALTGAEGAAPVQDVLVRNGLVPGAHSALAEHLIALRAAHRAAPDLEALQGTFAW